MERDDLMAVLTVFGAIAGPSQSWPEPVNVFHGEGLIPPVILHQCPKLTTGEGRSEPLIEFTGTLGANTTMLQLAQERIKLQPVEELCLLGAGTLPHRQAPPFSLPPAHDAGIRHEVARLAPRGLGLPFPGVELVQDLADHLGFF